MQEIKHATHSRNHPPVPQAAKLLAIPLMSLHTVTDNHAYQYVKQYVREKELRTLGDLKDTLVEIPEYVWALNYRMGPEIFAGSTTIEQEQSVS